MPVQALRLSAALALLCWGSSATNVSRCAGKQDSQGCPSPWSLLQIKSGKAQEALPAGAWEGEALFQDGVDGMDRVCRGASPSDNADSYFELHTGVATLSACQDLCKARASTCKGVEHSPAQGRCEVWIRDQGIGAVARAPGFTCLRFRPAFTTVKGLPEGACRGADANDNSPDYYSLHTGVETQDACEGHCLANPLCKGIEFAASMGGRCEVWTRDAGIGDSIPMSGFTCNQLGFSFEPVEVPATVYTLEEGPNCVLDGDKMKDVNVVGLSPTSALVCTLVEGQGVCRLLEMADGSLQQQERLDLVDEGKMKKLSVSRLSEQSALACWVEHGAGEGGAPILTPMCSALHVAEGELTMGAPFVLDDDEELILSLSIVGLSQELALVCYDRLDDQGLLGICSAVRVSDDGLHQLGSVELSAGEIDYGPEIVAAPLSSTSALVCYRDQDLYERAACSVITVQDGSAHHGPALPISDSHFHSLSAAGLSPTEAVVCFRDFASQPPGSVCKELTVSAGTVEVKHEVKVFSGKTSLARLSSTTALVCSSDTHHKHKSHCAVLSVGGAMLSKGPDLLVTDDSKWSFFTAGGLSGSAGLVCHLDDLERHRGRCAVLRVRESTA